VINRLREEPLAFVGRLFSKGEWPLFMIVPVLRNASYVLL